MIANQIPKCLRDGGPFQERFIRIRFTSNFHDFREERTIATLWGCIQRRITQSLHLKAREQQRLKVKDIAISKCVTPLPHNADEILQGSTLRMKTNFEEVATLRRTGEVVEVQSGGWSKLKASVLWMEIQWDTVDAADLSLLKFLIIPIKKKKEEEIVSIGDKRRIAIFNTMGAMIYRNEAEHDPDYISWPATLIQQQKRRRRENFVSKTDVIR